jgi:RHS repeat-associated protein
MSTGADGNVTLSIDARGKTTTYAYDSDSRLTKTVDPANSTTLEAYDKDGNVTLNTDALGHATTYAFDNDNRLTLTTNADSGATTMAYDAAGNMTLETDPLGDATTFAYDAADRKTMMTDPLGNSAVYAYDGGGLLTSMTDRDNRSQTLYYDGDGRMLTDIWYAAGSTTVVDTLLFTYDADGKIMTAADNEGSYSLTYDSAERVVNVTEPFTTSLSFSYDRAGNRTMVADSFGGTQNSTYNSANLLTNVQFSYGGNSIAQIGQLFNADNQVTEQLRYGPSSPPTGVANSTFTLDNAGRVTSLLDTNPSGTTTLASYSLAYDPAGNLTTQIDHGNTSTYSYDNAEQLTGDSSETFSYDADGNRSTYTFNATYKNELTYDGTWSYTYDGEGNEISKFKTGETWTYGYNNANEMISATDTVSGTVATSTIFKYDAFGNRIETDVYTHSSGVTTTTRFAYDGWDPAKGTGTGNENFDVWAEMDGSSSLTTRYMRGDVVDQVFARMTFSSGSFTTYWYLTDPQGTIRDVIDNNATVRDSVTYGAFGNITAESTYNSSGALETPANPAAYRGNYGWDSYETDASTGLIEDRARYYDPSTGRWISQDPLGFDAGDSNLYRYVNNRPTVETDPSGEELLAWDDYTKDQYLDYFKNRLKVPGIDAVQAASGRWLFTYNINDVDAIKHIVNDLPADSSYRRDLNAMISEGPNQQNIEVRWHYNDDGKTWSWWQKSTTLDDTEKGAVNLYYKKDYYTTEFSSGSYEKIAQAAMEARKVIQAADKIMNNDALWNKAAELFRQGTPIEKQMAGDRARYRTLVNKLNTGLVEFPPVFLKGLDSNDSSWWKGITQGGFAYCWGLHEPIYLRSGWFTQLSQSRLWLLLHEYGRTYFWTELRNQENTIAIGTTGEFDEMMQVFSIKYKTILGEQ